MSAYPAGYIEQLARPLWARRFTRDERDARDPTGARRKRENTPERGGALVWRVRAERRRRQDAAAREALAFADEA